MPARPAHNEYPEYYSRYVSRVPEGDVLDTIENQIAETTAFLATIDEKTANHRYTADKWSIKQVVGHLIDIERLFQYRVLAFARRDPAPLPGMEQDDYVDNANFDDRTLAELIDEYRITRQAGLSLFKSFDDDVQMRKGIANEVEFTVRTIPFILAGHDIHHIGVIKDRYL